MIQVKNGKVVQTQLPQVGVLSDGRTVSGYDLLPIEILEAEGWLTSEENKPTYDENTEQLEFDYYEILVDKVIIHYKIVTIPIPDPIINKIILSKDKESIIANNIDTITITANFEGEQVNTFNCYVTVNGPPAEQVTIENSQVTREFISETPGIYKIEFYAGESYAAIFIEVTEVSG